MGWFKKEKQFPEVFEGELKRVQSSSPRPKEDITDLDRASISNKFYLSVMGNKKPGDTIDICMHKELDGQAESLVHKTEKLTELFHKNYRLNESDETVFQAALNAQMPATVKFTCGKIKKLPVHGKDLGFPAGFQQHSYEYPFAFSAEEGKPLAMSITPVNQNLDFQILSLQNEIQRRKDHKALLPGTPS